MPQPPARQARRGTAFHRWLEERFGQQRLIDDDDLFADEDEGPDENLIELRAQFEAGQWGGRWPREVEVPFDMLIGGRQVRGRIDAVFAGPDGTFDVVDWKTGQPPRSQPEKDAVAVQLAAYRLAWSALADIPLGRVRAAFYYVRRDRTVRPADLLDEAGLVALINRVPVAGWAKAAGTENAQADQTHFLERTWPSLPISASCRWRGRMNRINGLLFRDALQEAWSVLRVSWLADRRRAERLGLLLARRRPSGPGAGAGRRGYARHRRLSGRACASGPRCGGRPPPRAGR